MMLKDFQLKQNLPFRPRTNRKQFQPDPRGIAVPGRYTVQMLTGDSDPRGADG